MITMTQGDYTFKNRVESGNVLGLFDIKKVVKRNLTLNEAEFILDRITGNLVSGSDDYVLTTVTDMWSNGDIKPYGVIYLQKDWAGISYDIGKALEMSGGAVSSSGFVIVYSDEISDELEYSKILPTQYFSNAFAKLYGMCPSGVVAMEDRVISTYDSDIEDDSIKADYVAYNGITPVAAFDIDEVVAPTLFLPHGEVSETWLATATNAIEHDLFYGKVPPSEGLVCADYSSTLSGKVLKSLRTFAAMPSVSSYFLSEKPLSSATSLTGIVKSVVDKNALINEKIVSDIESGLINEISFISVLESKDWSKLINFDSNSAYSYFVLNDDFAVLINEFNDKYLEVTSNAIRASYATMLALINQTIAYFNSSWVEKYIQGLKSGVSEVASAYADDMFDRMPQMQVFGANPRVFLNPELLSQLTASLPSILSYSAVDDNGMNQELLNKLPYLISEDMAQIVENYYSGTRPDLFTELGQVLIDPKEAMLDGKKVFDSEPLCDAISDEIVATGIEDSSTVLTQLFNAITSSTAAQANVSDVQASKSNKFWGLRCKWCLNWYWLQKTTYTGVVANNNWVVYASYIINPMLKKARWKFKVVSANVDNYYRRENMQSVLSQNGYIIAGGLPSGWTVLNDSILWRYQKDTAKHAKWYQPAWMTSHNVYSPWEAVDAISIQDPTAGGDFSRQGRVNFPTVFDESVAKAAGDAAVAHIKPMLDSISSVSKASAIGYCNLTYLRLLDVTKVAHFSHSYLNSLRTAIDLVEDKLSDEGVTKLEQFVSGLEVAMASCDRDPFYYLTESACSLGSRKSSEQAFAYSMMYGGNIID